MNPGGTISVRVGESSRDIVVEVQDDGPGVPTEDRSKVFDRFYRVDKARSAEAGGAGLGLSIAMWVIEAHGGSIVLDNASTSSCLFRIQLPLSGA